MYVRQRATVLKIRVVFPSLLEGKDLGCSRYINVRPKEKKAYTSFRMLTTQLKRLACRCICRGLCKNVVV